MSSFKIAIDKVLKDEGGYVENKRDLGGVTNYGISLRFLQTINKEATKETIQKLTKEEAEDLYYNHFWLANRYDEIQSQEIANKVFNTAVNVGPVVANRFLQTTLNILIFHGKKLEEDGLIGEQTIETVNLLYNEDVEDNVLKVYSLLQKEYYAKIIINRPEQIVFFKGWFKRADI